MCIHIRFVLYQPPSGELRMPYFTTECKLTCNGTGNIVKEVTHFADLKIAAVNPNISFLCCKVLLQHVSPHV
jgi:hypothetical protein